MLTAIHDSYLCQHYLKCFSDWNGNAKNTQTRL